MASPTTVSPRGSETNSPTGAPPARPGECALGGSAGSSSTPSLIIRPAEVTTATVPRAVAGTAETITSCAERWPAGAAPASGRSESE